MQIIFNNHNLKSN